MKTPRVSVLTTVYNRVKYVDECIASVLASSLTDFEYIIVDDLSSDGSWEAVQAWGNRDSRVRIFRNEINLGDYPNRNKAASLAKGEYLKYVDSDDVLYPHTLSVMTAMMDQFPSSGLGVCAVADFNQPHPLLLSPAEAYEKNFLLEDLFHGDLFGRAPGAVLIRREPFVAVGGFSGVNQVGDHELWLRLAAKYPLVTFPRDLLWDRTHGEQEQFYDSEADRARMHLDVDIASLLSPDCPVGHSRRDEAIDKLRTREARNIAKILLRGRLKEASVLRRKLGISWAHVFRALRCWLKA